MKELLTGLLTLFSLSAFSLVQNAPCGLGGSIEERIRDCSYQSDSEKEGFVLVTRTKELKEVYKELKTDLLWSDRLPKTMDHFSAEKACNSSLKEVAGINKSWRLPSKEEYEQAEISGIRQALPNMNYWVWSSSLRNVIQDSAWLFDGSSGGDYYVNRKYNKGSVRCVASM
jgi:hypothetical protein